jgi:hypothetical protein
MLKTYVRVAAVLGSIVALVIASGAPWRAPLP